MAEFDFVTIDFETANAYLDSACSVGIVAVKDLRIVEKFESLIKPETMKFDQKNIDIHGITPDTVENAATFNELWDKMKKYFCPHIPVVAHNARFDISIIKNCINGQINDFIYIDSMDIATPFTEKRSGLAVCAEAIGITLANHHDALQDATACAEIAIRGIEFAGCKSMWEYIALTDYVRTYRFSELTPQRIIGTGKSKKGFSRFSKIAPSGIEITADFIDASNPLYGKIVVFTGELTIDRSEAMQIAVNSGATVRTSVSSKTDFLVSGTQDIDIVGECGISTKEKKANQLNELGVANVKIISESAFLSMATNGVDA